MLRAAAAPLLLAALLADFAGDATTGSLRRFVRLVDAAAAAGALRTPNGSPMPVDLLEWAFHANFRQIPELRRRAYAVQGLALACSEPRVRSLVTYQLAGPPPLRGGRRGWDHRPAHPPGNPPPDVRRAADPRAPSVPIAPDRSPAGFAADDTALESNARGDAVTAFSQSRGL